jgi:hypothetical protein
VSNPTCSATSTRSPGKPPPPSGSSSVRDQLRDELVTPTTPLAFDAGGAARIKGWRESSESGSAAFNRRVGNPETLHIAAENGPTLSSWRAKVLLSEGGYRFTGRVRTHNLVTNQVARGGVTLRVSGERAAPIITAAEDWTTLSYDFEVSGLLDTELVCELRASGGSVTFDAASLKLVRLDKGNRPVPDSIKPAEPRSP